MGIGKILGIGLGIVGSLGAIGGITAAVVTKQNATTSLNTVNSSEDKTALANKQEEKKMVDDQKQNQPETEKEIEKDQTATNQAATVTTQKTTEVLETKEKINEKAFPECKGKESSASSYCGVL